MFLVHLKIAGLAVVQIFILGTIGFSLVRRKIIKDAGLDSISRMVIEVTLPVMIFCHLSQDFSFTMYPEWWIYPLISVAVNIAGFLTGLLLLKFISGTEYKKQFLSLTTFQNSGYMPLALIAALLTSADAAPVFIYLFLFLMGFNMLMFSAGVHMLVFHKNRKFELGSLFSPPVIATIFSLLFVFFGLNRIVPGEIMKPLRMVGDCTLPLAMIVVGGNLAQIRLGRIDLKSLSLMMAVKLLILPALGLFFMSKVRVPDLVGLLVIIQLAMPPATLLSVITRHYKKDDLLISQGIFFGHILSIITIPVFLSLYFALVMIK